MNDRYHGSACRRLFRFALIAAWTLAGCGSDAETTGAAAADEAPAGEPEAAQVEQAVVDVVLDEYFIDMPARLPPGATTFRVRNAGFEEHNFELILDGEEIWRFRTPLGPFASRTVEVDLEPGVYGVVCTFAGHEGRGMFMELVVGDAD